MKEQLDILLACGKKLDRIIKKQKDRIKLAPEVNRLKEALQGREAISHEKLRPRSNIQEPWIKQLRSWNMSNHSNFSSNSVASNPTPYTPPIVTGGQRTEHEKLVIDPERYSIRQFAEQKELEKKKQRNRKKDCTGEATKS